MSDNELVAAAESMERVGVGAPPIMGVGATPITGGGAPPIMGVGATPITGGGAPPIMGVGATPAKSSTWDPELNTIHDKLSKILKLVEDGYCDALDFETRSTLESKIISLHKTFWLSAEVTQRKGPGSSSKGPRSGSKGRSKGSRSGSIGARARQHAGILAGAAQQDAAHGSGSDSGSGSSNK